MASITKWYKSLSMSVQIGMHQSLLLIIVLALLVIVFYIQLEYLIPQLKGDQHEMFLMKSQQHLNLMLNYQRRLISGFLSLNGNQLMALHQIYLATQYRNDTIDNKLRYDNVGLNMFPSSLIERHPIIPAHYTYSFMCGSNKTAFNQNKSYQSQSIIGFSNMIAEIGPILNTQTLGVSTLFYGGVYEDPVMLYIYPCVNLGITFNYLPVTKRAWYVKALSEYESNQEMVYKPTLTDPFIYVVTNQIDISMTLPLVDINNKFVGAWAVDLQASAFAKVLQQNSMVDMILLADRNGVLLVHNFDNTQQILPLYLYNTTITGYTLTDWNLIKTNDTSNNTCDHYFQIPGYVCRYNSILNKQLHVFTTFIKQYEIYIILLTDQSTFKQQIVQNEQFIHDYFEQVLINVLTLASILLISIITLTTIVLTLTVQRPINRVIQLILITLQPIQQEHHFKQRILIPKFQSTQISNLLISFNRLFTKFQTSSFTKSYNCQLYEQFKYPVTKLHSALLKNKRFLKYLETKLIPEFNDNPYANDALRQVEY